jgi:DNA-binding NarL/FixJ family response regulator
MEHAELKPVQVLIADDHPLILAGVRRVLERSPGIEVIGEAQSASQLMQLIERRRPNVVLTDLRMPGVSGAECIEEIRENWPEVKVVVLSASEDRVSIDSALSAGASAFVLKSGLVSDLPSIIRLAAGGQVFHAPSVHAAAPGLAAAEDGPRLTEREQAILEAAADGLTTSAISRKLWVSEHTVKFHLTNIYRKLGVSNRAGAVRHAVAHSLLAA